MPRSAWRASAVGANVAPLLGHELTEGALHLDGGAQRVVLGDARGSEEGLDPAVPQAPQKRASSGFAAPQAEHRIGHPLQAGCPII
jgi:hypothetical protein